MGRILIFTICALALAVVTGALADNADDSGGPPPREPVETSVEEVIEIEEVALHDRFVEAILKSRSIKQKKGKRRPYWYECGERIKGDEARRARADEWATWILKSIQLAHETKGVELNPWGVLAVTHNESGFNVCALDLQTRQWAVSEGLVKNLQLTYSKDTIYKIISSEQFKKTRIKADFGPMQIRRKGNISRELLDQILSLDPGMVWAAEEMADRSLDYPVTVQGKRKPHPRPWKLWPTLNPRSARSYKYDRDMTAIARWLGAEVGEI